MAFLGAVRAARSFLRRNWWLAFIAIIGIQASVIHVRTSERDNLRVWQADVLQATRDAARQPKLAVDGVEQQIRDLGRGLDDVQAALTQARADALAAKLATEQADDLRRKEADDALASVLEKAHRAGNDYVRAHAGSVRSEAGGQAKVDRGDHARADLSGAAGAASVADGPGAEPALVSIPRSAFDTCTTLKVRLDNAHDWAIGGGK